MKKTIVLFCVILVSYNTSLAQDTLPRKTTEFYLTFAQINPFNVQLRLKKQIKKNVFINLGVVNLALNSNSSHVADTVGYFNTGSYVSAGVMAGIEFRKALRNHLLFFHGPGLSATYHMSSGRVHLPGAPYSNRSYSSAGYTFSLPYALGFLYNFNTHFLVSAEINPAVSFSYSEHKNGEFPERKYTNSGFGFGFSNSFVLLSFGYRL